MLLQKKSGLETIKVLQKGQDPEDVRTNGWMPKLRTLKDKEQKTNYSQRLKLDLASRKRNKRSA
jgi:hypothetical protein